MMDDLTVSSSGAKVVEGESFGRVRVVNMDILDDIQDYVDNALDNIADQPEKLLTRAFFSDAEEGAIVLLGFNRNDSIKLLCGRIETLSDEKVTVKSLHDTLYSLEFIDMRSVSGIDNTELITDVYCENDAVSVESFFKPFLISDAVVLSLFDDEEKLLPYEL